MQDKDMHVHDDDDEETGWPRGRPPAQSPEIHQLRII